MEENLPYCNGQSVAVAEIMAMCSIASSACVRVITPNCDQ